MTDLNASGGGSDDYSKRPKGNIDRRASTSSGRPTSAPTGSTRSSSGFRRTSLACRLVLRRPRRSPTPGADPAAPHRRRRLRRLRRPPRRRPTPAPTPDPAPSARAGELDEPGQRDRKRRTLSEERQGAADVRTRARCPSSRSAAAARCISSRRDRARCVSSAWARAGSARGPATSISPCGCRAASLRSASPGPTGREIGFGAGDTLRGLQSANGAVTYAKNGRVFYTSTVRADRACALMACSSAAERDRLRNVTIGSGERQRQVSARGAGSSPCASTSRLPAVATRSRVPTGSMPRQTKR